MSQNIMSLSGWALTAPIKAADIITPLTGLSPMIPSITLKFILEDTILIKLQQIYAKKAFHSLLTYNMLRPS